MLLLLASKKQRSSSITARSMCGVHAAPRSMCGAAGCGIYTRRASAAGDLHTSWNQHTVEHSEQTVNHNTTLPRNVIKTRQKYKHESALFSAFARARRPEGRRIVRPRLVLINAWTKKKPFDKRSFFTIWFVFLIFVAKKELKSEAPVRFPLKTAKNGCYVLL